MRYKEKASSKATDEMRLCAQAIGNIVAAEPGNRSDRSALADISDALGKLERTIETLARLRDEPLVVPQPYDAFRPNVEGRKNAARS